jgi:putative membrane protein
MKFDQLGEALVTTAAISVVGLLLFCLAFFIIDKLTPFSLRKEIEEDHNMALAVIMGAVIIGMALIVSAAVSG